MNAITTDSVEQDVLQDTEPTKPENIRDAEVSETQTIIAQLRKEISSERVRIKNLEYMNQNLRMDLQSSEQSVELLQDTLRRREDAAPTSIFRYSYHRGRGHGRVVATNTCADIERRLFNMERAVHRLDAHLEIETEKSSQREKHIKGVGTVARNNCVAIADLELRVTQLQKSPSANGTNIDDVGMNPAIPVRNTRGIIQTAYNFTELPAVQTRGSRNLQPRFKTVMPHSSVLKRE